METDELHTAGEALFGDQWQRALARAIGVNERTMRRWAAGGKTPDWLPEKLAALADAKIEKLRSILK
jgi:DNA-binding XRE family transcriptional regulator